MILVIDNYDSFTYNLVQYIGTLQPDLEVYRNDKISVEEIRDRQPEKIVISPGPGRPEQAGISTQLIQSLGKEIPILGICLGHQAVGVAYNARVVRAPEIVHGKTSRMVHNGGRLFRNVTNPFQATRYHSLIVDRDSLPGCLRVTVETDSGLVMGLAHTEYPVQGIQFHPESIVTEQGMQIIQNFVEE